MVANYLTLSEIEAAAKVAQDGPKALGTIDMIVARPAVDSREVRKEAYFSPEGGLEGDRWTLKKEHDPEHSAQIAVIGTRFLTQIAGGDPDRMAQAGDNLVINMDLSESNLPAGTQLEAGEVVFEVTPRPHLGCAKLSKRFGQDVLRFVNQKENRPLKLRGIYVRVVKAGTIRRGDEIRKKINR